MAGSDGAPSRTDPLGVVDPIHLPAAGPLVRGWTGLPALGQAFIGLALVDVVLRALGIGGLSLFVDLAQPLTIVAILPHLALVLLPVAVLARRRDAAAQTTLVLAGAVALSLAELLSGPLLLLYPGTADSLGTWTLLHVLTVVGRAGGWIALAVGLGSLTRSVPSPSLLGLSNLATFAIAGSAVSSIVVQLVLPLPDFGDPAWTSQVRLVALIGPLPGLALALLGRVIVRGSVDVRRPLAATYTATGAVLLTAAFDLVNLAANALVLVQTMLALSGDGPGAAPSVAIPNLTGMAGVLLVVAFGLGLADASGRIPRGAADPDGPPAPEREPVQWPSHGGEVPAFRPAERPVDRPVEPAARRTKQRTRAGKSRPRSARKKESPG